MRGCFAVVTALVLSVIGQAAKANITYQINAYPAYQIGITDGLQYSLTGSITTDGTIGALSKSNILSWQYTSIASDGSRTVSYSSSDANTSTTLIGSVIATPTEIQIPRGSPTNTTETNALALAGPITTPAVTTIALTWWTQPAPSSTLIWDFFGIQGTRVAPLAGPWNSPLTFGTPLNLPTASGPIILATVVPEPASLSAMGIAMLCSLRRRR